MGSDNCGNKMTVPKCPGCRASGWLQALDAGVEDLVQVTPPGGGSMVGKWLQRASSVHSAESFDAMLWPKVCYKLTTAR